MRERNVQSLLLGWTFGELPLSAGSENSQHSWHEAPVPLFFSSATRKTDTLTQSTYRRECVFTGQSARVQHRRGVIASARADVSNGGKGQGFSLPDKVIFPANTTHSSSLSTLNGLLFCYGFVRATASKHT